MTAQTTSLPQDVADRFGRRFAATPRLFRAPGRLNVIGEHTDHQDGFVLPAAIDRDCVVAAAPNAKGFLRVVAVDAGAEADIALDTFTKRGDWRDYVAGVALTLKATGAPICGADIVIQSAVPQGAGLSSSAALEVAIGLALAALGDISIPPLELARHAQAAERAYAGVPCGLMDQMASACGRANHALLFDCLTHDITAIPAPAHARFVIFDTAMAHDLRDGGYATRVAETRAAAAFFGRSLRHVTHEELATAQLPETLKARARHVIGENARVKKCAEFLLQGDMAAVGGLMNRSHASLRDDFDVSTPALDLLADSAACHPGCHGARMMGAGFGGSVIALVDTTATEHVAEAVSEQFARRYAHAPHVLTAALSDGASEIML